MESSKKIKIFISSICDTELKDFNQVDGTEKAIRISYNLIRRALKVALVETGLFEVYVFEDESPSTLPVGDDYLGELDSSDVCIFLIDNFYPEISKGLLTEITRAQKNNKKSFYLFLNHTGKEKTSVQENLTGIQGAHYFTVNDIREFIGEGYKAIINDIIKIYQNYCDGKIDYKERDLPSVEITADSFPTDTTDIDKQIFKNLGKTKNKIASLVYRVDDKEIQTSELDELSFNFLEVLLGERKFSDFNLSLLLDSLEKTQSPILHEVVSQRWKVISNRYSQELESALKTVESIFDTYSNDTAVPKWIINDVLIDWRNIQTVDDEIKNIYSFSVQEKINQQDTLIFFPLADRFSSNISEDMWNRNFNSITGSPFSTTIYNLDHLFGYIANYLFTALYYGSYTHLLFTLKKIQTIIFDVLQKEDNLRHKVQLIKISVLWGDEKSLDKILSKYISSFSHSTAKEIYDIYELANTKHSQHEQNKWKIILFKELGYYFSNDDYETVSKEIATIFRQQIEAETTNIRLTEKLIKAWESNSSRLPQNEIITFSITIFNKQYRRYFDNIFKLLLKVDFSEQPSDLLSTLLEKTSYIIDNEEKTDHYQQYIKSLLVRIRKQRDDFDSAIDETVEKHFPDFHKKDYSLEIFPDKQETHIQRYLDSIKARNQSQGINGVYSMYVDHPYITIKNILEIERITLPEELLHDLLIAILDTLYLETQTHPEKIEAIQLLMNIKASHEHDWETYYSKLEKDFEEIENGYSGFFTKDERLSLRLNILLLRIMFSEDCAQELLEVLALINNSSEYDKISSLIAIRDFLLISDDNLTNSSITSILVQYTSTHCFSNSGRIRYETVLALYSLLNTEYISFIVGRLTKMMDDDNFNVRWAILDQSSLIEKLDKQAYSYILQKAKIDSNYLVRRMVEDA